MKKKSYTTSGMSECILESEKSWNVEIEKSILELKQIVSPETYRLIYASQKEWEKYRDIQRKVIYKTIWQHQGTMYINISHTEDVAITKNRAKWLFQLTF